MITIEKIEEALDLPAEKWKGRCYEISCAVVNAGLVDGDPVYGHFLGSIARGSMFDRGGLFARHGWIRTAENIVDVTRWVFEKAEPYVFVGELDDPEYDEGGNQLRAAMRQPLPEFDPAGEVNPEGKVTPDEWAMLNSLAGSGGRMCVRQLCWVANTPIQELDDAKAVYTAFKKLGLHGFVPYDNWHMVMK